jgi:glycosyltransferase involved in cell wall biosynthesis
VAAAQLDVPLFAAGSTMGPNGDNIGCTHLHLLGSLDETGMAEQYASAAIFVSPARYEPFGFTVLEAAQAGCALVLADIATFRELWDCAALFIDPLDSIGIATAVRALARDPRRAAHLGDLAQRRAAALTPERMVAATWRIHQNACAAPMTLAAA